jgi:TonB family protein
MRINLWFATLIPLAAVASQPHERPPLVTVATSDAHEVDGGSWSSLTKRTATPWPCGRDPATRCVENSVVVDNQSPQTLECSAAFDQSGDAPVTGTDIPALVLPRSAHEIHGPIATAGTPVSLSHLECRARPPYKRLPIGAGCKYEMFGEPFEKYYPSAAVSQGLEGPVVVAFSLAARRGHASDVAVADSSLGYSLDEAAKRFVNDQLITTNCPGTRFDVRMRFTLRDRYLDAGR